MAIDKIDLKTIEKKQLRSKPGLDQFMFIADNMKSAVLTFDMKGNLTYSNKAFKSLTGFEISELDYNFISCFDPYDQSRVKPLWQNSFKNQEFTLEVMINKKSGVNKTLSLFCHSLIDSRGMQVGVYVRLADLFKFKQTEFAFQQMENNVRRAIYSAPFPALIVSENGEILEINKMWRDVTGYTAEDIPDFRKWLESSVDSDNVKIDVFSYLVENNPGHSNLEIEVATRDNSKQIWQVSASKIGNTVTGSSLYLFMGVDITDRKSAEARLVESEKILRLITKNIKSAVLAYSNEKKLIYANPAFASLTGSERSIDKIKDFLSFIHPKDLKKIEKIIRGAYTGKSYSQEEFRIIDADNRTIWVNSNWNPFLDDDQIQIGMQVRVSDISEKHEIQEALKISEANIRAILNNTSQCFMLVSHDYKLKTFNKIADSLAKRVYGQEFKEGLSLKTLIAPEDAEDFKNCFDFAMQGYPITIERNIKGNNKKDNWVEMSFVPVYEEGKTVNSVCVGILDISIRKKANQILETSENRFRSLVQNSSDLTCIIDKKCKIKYLSPVVKHMFGYKPGKLLYNNYLDYIHEDDQKLFLNAVKNALKGQSLQLEYRFKNNENQWVFLQSVISDLHTEESIKGIVINSRDVTQTKVAQDDLNESKHFIQRIANSMPNILYLYELLDEDNYLPIYINQSLLTVLGYDPKRVVTENIMKYSGFVHPDDLEERQNVLERIHEATEEEVVESELRVKDASKQWRWMHVREVIFSRHQNGKVKEVLGTAEDITRRKNIEEQLARGALFDTLTGLPNRRYFMQKLTEAIVRQKRDPDYQFAVLFLDVDRFKIINDSLGHDIGDQLLIAISQRLRNSVSETDFVARLGGDEFTILMEYTKSNRQIIQTAERIQRKLNTPFSLNHMRISATCSIGIAPSTGNYTDPESILRDSDTAMYRAKNRGRNSYAMFNKQMHTYVMKILQTEGDLRRAIINNELEIYYQPIVSLTTNKIVSCEALIRWNHPVQGLIQPGEFLGVAEETGLMLQLDKFSLFESCRQNFLWQSKGLPKIRVAVNLSLNELRQKKVKELITNILKQTKMDPEYLDVELTENILIENLESNLEMLKDLRKMGVSLSIDDFGTGYSSLTYIKQLPSNYLKIDRSFVTDVDKDESDAAIVKSIINLAHNLNLQVIAEGVETIEQLDFLKLHKCDMVQGYYLGRPMPAMQFEKLLSKNGGA